VAAAFGSAAVGASTAGPAAAADTGPAETEAGPGCPATMLAWLPSAADMASGNPQAVAPGNLSPQAQTDFGTQVLSLLAGQDVSWLGSTGCTQSDVYSVTRAGGASRAPVARYHASTATTNPPQPSPNWAGFQSTLKHFTGASMTWVVPTPGPVTAPAAVAIWPGIGQGTSNDELIQAGTSQDADGNSFAWTELFPLEAQQVVNNFPVSPRDNMAVNVAWDSATHTAAFLLEDYSTHKGRMVTQSFSGSSGSSAEWIVERPVVCASTCIIQPLLKFGSVSITNGAADQTVNGTTKVSYIGGFSDHFQIPMTNCIGNETLARPPSDVAAQGDFSDTWVQAGPADPYAGASNPNCQWTISPAGAPFSATLLSPGKATLNDTTAGLAIACGVSTLSGTTSSSPQFQQGAPAVLVILTKSVFNGCADSGGNVWSATQVSGSAWDIRGDAGSTGGVMTGDIGGPGGVVEANVTGTISGKSCTLRLSGTVPAGGLTYTNPDTLKITTASLTVSNVSGAACGTAGVHDGDAVTWSASYHVNSLVIDP
jgi:hypothetical protein